MNKTDLINIMAEEAGITKEQATHALQAYELAISETLASGGNVILEGFGTFSTTVRAARKGHDPRHSAKINIAAKTVVKFKTGKALDKAVS